MLGYYIVSSAVQYTFPHVTFRGRAVNIAMTLMTVRSVTWLSYNVCISTKRLVGLHEFSGVKKIIV